MPQLIEECFDQILAIADAITDSLSRYAAVRQSLGAPGPFKLKHRTALLEIVQALGLLRLGKRAAFARIAAWAGKNIETNAQDQSREERSPRMKCLGSMRATLRVT